MSEDIGTIFNKIITKENTLKESIWKRMDIDRDLELLVPYSWKMKTEFGKIVDVPGAENVTLNLPLIFKLKCDAILMSALRLWIVKGKKFTEDQCATVENFIELLFLAADKRLRGRGLVDLVPYWTQQINGRGRVAARMTLRTDKNEFIPDIVPMDTRWLAYEHDTDGLVWTSYYMLRSPAMIKSEYGKLIEGKNNKVIRDYWDREQNIVFLDAEPIKNEKNPYGEPPVVYQKCHVGSSYNDIEAAEHDGESVFWPNREMFTEANKSATICQSLSVNAYGGAVLYKSESGDVVPDRSPQGKFKVTGARLEESVEKWPIEDVKQATLILHNFLIDCIEMGGLTSIDLGSLNFPMSSLGIERMISNRNQIFVPRLDALMRAYEDLADMAISQVKSKTVGKSKIELLEMRKDKDDYGELKEFKAKDLEGDYHVACELHAIYPETDISNYSVANAAQRWFDDPYIMSEILKTKNADERYRRRQIQMAEQQVPQFALFNLARGLIKEGKPVEAKLLAQIAKQELKQLLAGNINASEQFPMENTKQNDNLTALIGAQNTGTSTVTPRRNAQILSTQTKGKGG